MSELWRRWRFRTRQDTREVLDLAEAPLRGVASRRVVGIEHAILGGDQPEGVSSPTVASSLSTTALELGHRVSESTSFGGHPLVVDVEKDGTAEPDD